MWLVGAAGELQPVLYFGLLEGFIYLLYAIECCYAKTGKYLWNIMSREECTEHHHAIMATAPYIYWSIQCYHLETHTRVVSDGNGGTRTETYTVRVNTHAAACTTTLSLWADASDPLGNLKAKLTKLKFLKHFIWVDAASERRHDHDFAAWIRYHVSCAILRAVIPYNRSDSKRRAVSFAGSRRVQGRLLELGSAGLQEVDPRGRISERLATLFWVSPN